MNMRSTEIEAEWGQVLSDAENAILQVLGTIPKDQMAPYARDLRVWAARVSDDAIRRAWRILNALGYSRPQVATVLGISMTSINRILEARERSERRPGDYFKSVSQHTPERFIDVRAEFERLGT